MVNTRRNVTSSSTEATTTDVNATLDRMALIMEKQMQELQELRNRQQNSKVGDYLKDFKRLNPPVFKGLPDHMEAERWISQTEKIFSGMQCPETEKVNLAVFMMEGEADFWWKATKSTKDDWTWVKFKDMFYEKFFPLSVRDSLAADFLTLEQGDLSVAQYAAKFDELSRFAQHMVSTEDLKARKFERGLKGGIRNKLVLWRCPTYAEVMEKALLAEQEYLTWRKQTGEKPGQIKKNKKNFENAKSNQKKEVHALKISPGKFKGNCRLCKKVGHKAFQCPTSSRAGTSQQQKVPTPVAASAIKPINVKCYKCGKLGHYVNKCTQPPQQMQQQQRLPPRPQQQFVQGRVYALTRGESSHNGHAVEGDGVAKQE